MNIRVATEADQKGIREIYLTAFDASENETVAALAIELCSTPEALNLVAEREGILVGHVAFSPVWLDGEPIGYVLAPLAVSPSNQRHGIGRQLVETGLQQLKEAGASLVFVYGDPAYYHRFGFKLAGPVQWQPPHPLSYPEGWQVLRLNEADGMVATGAGALSCVEALRRPEMW